jgi:hypothetical protein
VDNERAFIGRFGLAVLVAGALGALAIGSFASTLSALRFAMAAAAIAIALGIIGWNTLSGRITVVGGVILALALGAAFVLEEMRLQKAESAPARSGQLRPRPAAEPTGHCAFIRSMRIRAVSGRMTRGSGSSPARSFSRSSRPAIVTCL